MVESPVAAAIESEKTRILSIDPSLQAIFKPLALDSGETIDRATIRCVRARSLLMLLVVAEQNFERREY
jgi:hypothetical protein